MNECCDIDWSIVSAAITRGIMSKPVCRFWAQILKTWKHFVT